MNQTRFLLVGAIIYILLFANANAISPEFAKQHNLKVKTFAGIPKNMMPILYEDYCYVLLGDYKLKEPDEFLINPTNSFGLTSAQIKKMTQDAMSTWELYNKNIFGNLTVDPTATIDTSGDKSFIYFNKNSNLGKYIPGNTMVYYFDDKLIGSNIELNAKDFVFGDYTKNQGTTDFQGILTHELGHGLGLGDAYFLSNPKCQNQTMGSAYGYDGAYNLRTLELGDKFGAFILYSNLAQYAKYKDYWKIKEIKYYKYN